MRPGDLHLWAFDLKMMLKRPWTLHYEHLCTKFLCQLFMLLCSLMAHTHTHAGKISCLCELDLFDVLWSARMAIHALHTSIKWSLYKSTNQLRHNQLRHFASDSFSTMALYKSIYFTYLHFVSELDSWPLDLEMTSRVTRAMHEVWTLKDPLFLSYEPKRHIHTDIQAITAG